MERPAINRLEQLIHQAASKSFDIGVSMAIIQTAINDNALVGDNKIPAKELKHKLLIETKDVWDTMLNICYALGEVKSEKREL